MVSDHDSNVILVCADGVGVRGHIAAGNEGYVTGGDRRERVTFAGDMRGSKPQKSFIPKHAPDFARCGGIGRCADPRHGGPGGRSTALSGDGTLTVS
jgi:hypothetical protein